MKKIAVLLLTGLMALSSKSQFNASVNLGYSIGKSPTAGLDIGYNLKEINFHSGFLAHMSSSVDQGILTYVKAGHTFDIGSSFYATGSAGYAFLYKSADDKSKNSSQLLYSAEFGRKIEFRGEPLGLYIGAVKAGEFVIANIGIRGYF